MSGDTRSKMRVLFVDHTAKMGGGEIALLNLVSSLDNSAYTPVVLLFEEGPLSEKLRGSGVEVHVLPLNPRVLQTKKDSLGVGSLLRAKSVFSTLTYVLRIARFMRGCDVRLVHTNSLKSDVIGGLAARLAAKPLVWHVRDRIDSDYLPRPVVYVFRRLCRWLPNRVIANSLATLRTLRPVPDESGGDVSPTEDSGRMRVVHDGMPGTSRLPEITMEACRRVGLVGRISPWKGQHVFLRAAAQVHAAFPEVRFQIIGSAMFGEQAYEQEVRDLTRSLGLDSVVELTGFREDVARMIGGLEILVHASTTGEPFGQVI